MIERPDPSSLLDRADLYLEWAHATQYAYVFRGAHDHRRRERADDATGSAAGSIGLLVQWHDADGAARALVEAGQLGVHVPNVYAKPGGPGARAMPRLIWAITVALPQIDAFLAATSRFAERIELAAPIAGFHADIDNILPSPSEGSVLAAVLDDGCAFANMRFRPAGDMRIIWLWNQNAHAYGAPLSGGHGPSLAANFGYGRQLSRIALRNLCSGPHGTQDEAYAKARLAGLRRAASHGTHVMDLLAGEEAWEIAFVQFPESGVNDPSGLWLKRYALDGLHYAIECAGPSTTTIVVNLSWGPQTGPHNGSSLLETAIEMLVAEQKALSIERTLIVSLPAGNSFASQAHAQIDVANGGQVDWLVPPDGETPAFIELWWPDGVALDDARLRVTPPSGPAVDVLPGQNIATDMTWWVKLKAVGSAVAALVVVHPTGGFARHAAKGQHGRWILEIDPAPSGADGDVHLYVARADHNMGARRGATASRLTDAALEAGRYVAPAQRNEDVIGSSIRRAGTLNGIATGASTLVAAGFVYQPFDSAPYSSSGPTRGATAKPDYACMTDRSPARAGVRASGVRTGTKTTLVGTSTAAPQLGRLAANKDLNPIIPIPYRKERVGKGCLRPDPALLLPD
jgi:hypothetical protein